MTVNQYQVGNVVHLSTVKPFTDLTGATLDPTTVFLEYTPPGGSATTLQYGVGNIIVKDAVGTYHADVQVDTAGIWLYRWYSTGTGRASDERYFIALATLEP